ncbi:unnamed protein product [Rotaria sordida]|uniref:Uncharacterized protein n=1 Tax=Rotaria sordida TaxID=392033 RepID=A0A816EDG2_9BILA|nr:unnamed protein product [Rotaria sordida]CAF1646127.1 unnamed protein product [Rotaria sordida]
MDCEDIDFNRTEQITSWLTNNEQQEYQSKTLPDKNNGRFAYLPLFPTKSVGIDDCLLLTNVPGSYFNVYPQEIILFTCTRSNIVYAMTCPCGYYDYINSTAKTLTDAMAYHRKHGNRIIHEKLTGSALFRGSLLDPEEQEKDMANKMRLYQHSARCPVALRAFLDCNPIYWCFIPLYWKDALSDNTTYYRGPTMRDPILANVVATTAIHSHRLAQYLDRVPLPPAAYVFSYRQLQKQRIFFERFVNSSIHELPYAVLDLYKMAIITILPDDHSILLRYIIETLFIIHDETKLNMICPIGSDVERRYGPPYNSVWCANLNYSSI